MIAFWSALIANMIAYYSNLQKTELVSAVAIER